MRFRPIWADSSHSETSRCNLPRSVPGRGRKSGLWSLARCLRLSKAMTHDLNKILLVEDDPDIRTVARIALEDLGGYRVVTCASGNVALEVAPSIMPQLVLLDMMMPGLDGIETMQALRMLSGLERVPVIFITARAQRWDVERLRKVGAAAVIAKPFDPMRLPQLVESLWDLICSGVDCFNPGSAHPATRDPGCSLSGLG